MKNETQINIGSYKNATGEVIFNMTNDYMFRVVNQKNPTVAKGISCAVLHLDPATVKSAEITNPIILGNSIDDKTFVLDIEVLLDNSAIINLEMQVINEHNWQDRSLSYLCRSFDQLHQGDDYPMTKPAIHAGFLNFQPFPEFPQFHASYKLINEENGMVFSDKFHLNVIDLTHINLSTDADKEFQLDIWAKFFTAKTWEEVIMLAENNPYIDEAAQTLYEANADRLTQEQCRARRNYYKEKHAAEQELQKRDAIIVEQNAIILEKDAQIIEKDTQLMKKDVRIAELEAQLAKLQNN
jgi:predicted transposase/invertase (TIGR01784 family)